MSTPKTPGEVAYDAQWRSSYEADLMTPYAGLVEESVGYWERIAAAVIAHHEAWQVLTREQAKGQAWVLAATAGVEWAIVSWVVTEDEWQDGLRSYADEKFIHFRRLPEAPK